MLIDGRAKASVNIQPIAENAVPQLSTRKAMIQQEGSRKCVQLLQIAGRKQHGPSIAYQQH